MRVAQGDVVERKGEETPASPPELRRDRVPAIQGSASTVRATILCIVVDLKTERRLACDLATEAGHLLLQYHRQDLVVETKSCGEPVSEADRASSRLIVAGLQAEFPRDVIVSEEEPVDLPRMASARRVWLVDPLDGTREFTRGLESFSVLIGLVVDGRPVLGVVYEPCRQRLYFAAPDTPVVCIEGGTACEIRSSSVSDPTLARLVVSETDRRPAIDVAKARMGIRDESSSGSVGLKLSLIAAGKRDLYINPTGNAKVWDTAAAQAILEAAGGRITDMTGRDLDYGGRDLWHRRGLVAASNERLHEAALRAVEPLASATDRIRE